MTRKVEAAYQAKLPGRAEPTPDQPFRERRPAQPALSREPADGDVRAGLLLGRREEVLADAGRLQHGGRLRRRTHAQPHLPRGLQRPDRPHRGGAGGVRPAPGLVHAAAAACSGRTTTRRRACARATTSARQYRSAIYTYDDEQLAAAERLARHLREGAGAGPATAPSAPRSAGRPSFTTPRTTTSSTWPRTRTATAGWAAPAWPARWGRRWSAAEPLSPKVARRRRRGGRAGCASSPRWSSPCRRRAARAGACGSVGVRLGGDRAQPSAAP